MKQDHPPAGWEPVGGFLLNVYFVALAEAEDVITRCGAALAQRQITLERDALQHALTASCFPACWKPSATSIRCAKHTGRRERATGWPCSPAVRWRCRRPIFDGHGGRSSDPATDKIAKTARVLSLFGEGPFGIMEFETRWGTRYDQISAREYFAAYPDALILASQ